VSSASRRSGDFLVASARRVLLDDAAPLPAPGSVDLRSLRAAAQHHRVQPIVRAAVQDVPAHQHVADAVEDDYWRGLTTHLRALTDLSTLADTLAAAAVEWVAFKGPVLAETVYPRPDLRMYSDIDVLVDPRRLGAALDALEAAGFAVIDQNWDLLRRRMLGELHLRAPAGSMVDLHWHMVNRPENRSGLRLEAGTLLDQSTVARVAGRDLPVLSPSDTCVHLAVHAALSGGDRLLWSADLALALRAVDAPDALLRRAKELGAARHLALMLSRAHALLPTAQSAEVFGGVVPSAPARRALGLANALSPVERVTGGKSLTSFLARTTAATTSQSLRNVGRRARRRLARPTAPATPPISRSDNPDSVLFAAGGMASRAAFVAAVERSGRHFA
jgi:hypothetical protein